MTDDGSREVDGPDESPQQESIGTLVGLARDGDEQAWRRLVRRFAPLAVAVARAHRLSPADTEEVVGTVWLRLVEHLDDLREPRARAGWIRTTTRNEALRVIRLRRRTVETDPADQGDRWPSDDETLDRRLLDAELHQALREALCSLSVKEQTLMRLLLTDPPVSYEQISVRLGIPLGSIGPTRARCLRKLRRSTMLRSLAVEADSVGEGR